MIHSLEYDVQFSKTGRRLTNVMTFGSGVTAIVGANESGKSFSMEMLRYNFFGSAALRGTADDYATLVTKMGFSIKGKHYTVSRTLSKATLLCGDEPIAVGTKPVNLKILEILGFDLEVFDIVCSVNQGRVEQLADMRPTERKQMIDRVVGADRLEKLGQWCGEQALLSRRELDTLKRTLVEPIEPEVPSDYADPELLSEQIREIEVLQPELAQILVKLQNPPLVGTAPSSPSKRSLSELEDELAATTSRQAEWTRVNATPVLDFDPVALEHEWEQYRLSQRAIEFVRQNPKPTTPRAELTELVALHIAQTHLRQLLAQKDRLEKSPTLTCPCGKVLSFEQQALDEVTERIRGLGDVDLSVKLDPQLLHRELSHHDNWDKPETVEEWKDLKDVPLNVGRPARAVQSVSHMITAQEKEARLRALEAEGPLDPNPLRTLIQSMRQYQAAELDYWNRVRAHTAFEELRPALEARRVEIEKISAGLGDLKTRYWAAKLYDQQRVAWLDAKELYDQRVAEIAAIEVEQGGWSNAKTAMTALRAEIKGHLAPALSAVASVLLSRMTSGARNSVVVDEEFEIMVDGQPIKTLSGSGKACANIALRLGLARVLTNDVLSLFIGDEIDASMDDQRARNLQEVILNLENSVSQIFLVTHKSITVSNVIEMGHERKAQ